MRIAGGNKQQGYSDQQLRDLIPVLKEDDARWDTGKIFGFVYHPGSSVAALSDEFYRAFINESTINPTAFPSLRRFEKDIVAKAVELTNGNNQVAGTLTSGGTESIFLALKVARDYAREKFGTGREFEVIVPETIHPAFLKACDYLSLKAVISPVGDDRRADPEDIKSRINKQSIMICASAPCYPYGLVDPVSELGCIAAGHKLLFHVDACMGGFMLPCLESLNYDVPLYDFRVKGVTSISLDAHKYGYAPKGVSLVLYRNRSLRRKQFYVYPDWPGGIFASTGFMGTKSGGPVAACWAVMKKLGDRGYRDIAARVMDTANRIKQGINDHPGLEVISDPDMPVFAFRSLKDDIFNIGDALTAKGWHLDKLQFPEALHITVSQLNIGMEETFLEDLYNILGKPEVLGENAKNTARSVKLAGRISSLLPGVLFEKLALFAGKTMGGKKSGSQAAIYGISATLEDRKNIKKLVLNLMDGMY